MKTINSLPATALLSPEPDPNALEAFSYKKLKNVLGEMHELAFSILCELEERGLIEGKFYDRLLLCPHCKAHNICFRDACPKCHSTNLEVVELIHHFRCGYVGSENEFSAQNNSTLNCPKCSYRLLSVGKDYEKPSEIFKCLACNWSGSEPLTLGRCIVCDKNCDPGECIIADIKSYRITSLGKLAADSGDIGHFLETKPDGLIENENNFSKINNLIVLADELGRVANRYGFTQIVMAIYPDAIAALNDDIKQSIEHSFIVALTEKIRALLRLTDYITYDSNLTLYAVLPHTDIDGTEILAKRLLDDIANTAFSGSVTKTTLSIGIIAWGQDVKASWMFAQTAKVMKNVLEHGGNAYAIGNIDENKTH
ncbi:MAG: hypothetical protein L3J71_15810 [Victivallaceae bacterium]|nr:hypothetical protein [Victivallaceae bacterium]